MPTIGANVARYYFEAAEFDPDTFLVLDFQGSERISGLFRFEINLLSEDADIDFGKVVNKPATFLMMRGREKVPIHGIVSDIRQGGRTKDYFHYSVTLRPRLWLLSLSHRSEIYQQQTVEEIIKHRLTEAGFAPSDFRFDLQGSYDARVYCVQHRESDLDFISRLLEHEGIFYFFDHEGDRETMVMSDSRDVHEPILGEDVMRFHEGSGMTTGDKEVVYGLLAQERVVTGKVVLKDYNYETPDVSLTVESQINGSMPGSYYDYGQHFKTAGEGQRLAEARNQEIECVRREIRAGSTCMGFRSGFLFTLEDHFREDLDADYLLTEILHEGSQRRAAAMELGLRGKEEDESAGEQLYGNRFTAIPSTVQFRPPRLTPKPHVGGLMTGKIESSGGDYPHVDDVGRYRARMHFDTGDSATADATLPIRMSQFHSGPDYGIHFPNHADTEAVWACVNGDVDRPVVLGTVPNPNNTSPVAADNKAQNIIRTKSGNQLVMDDTIDEAQFQLNTPDAHTILLDDKDDKIQIITTKKHRIILSDKDANVRVETTSGHFLLMQDDKDGGKITMQSKDGHWIGVNDKDKVITVADESGENTFVIDAQNGKLVIKTDNGNIDFHAPNGKIDIQATELNIETSGDTTIKAGGNQKLSSGTDFKIEAGQNLKANSGMDLTISAGMNLTSEATMNHDSTAGMNVTVEGSMNAEFKGGIQAAVQGGAMATVKGGVVMIN